MRQQRVQRLVQQMRQQQVQRQAHQLRVQQQLVLVQQVQQLLLFCRKRTKQQRR